ncbi:MULTISPECIES: hypothetical protein [Sinorhizobium]|uniref:hypothetical protein n=1 Tax=Sinorhizobium TaxID=28105 RepID=UPI001F3E9F8E|nr:MULTISPECIES: hypothetical protein [Sinorhizobium]
MPLNFHPAAIRASAISIRQFTWREQPAEVGVPLCIRLAEAGHSLILAARNADRLQALANQLKGHDRHIAQAVGSFGETPGFHYGTKDFQLAVTSNIKSLYLEPLLNLLVYLAKHTLDDFSAQYPHP